MKDKELEIAYFLSFCIEQYKKSHQLSGNEVIALFDLYEILPYLEENFEVLHTQGSQWLIEEIDELITLSHFTFYHLPEFQRSKGGLLMNLEITDKNLYLLLPGKISRLAQIYAHEHHITLIEALRRFYRSETYKKLADENTKLWHYGPVALYQEFTAELKSSSLTHDAQR